MLGAFHNTRLFKEQKNNPAKVFPLTGQVIVLIMPTSSTQKATVKT